MADTYISNGEAHITVGSEDWKNYCEFLEAKLTALEEQRMKLDNRIREIHAILHPAVIVDIEDEESGEKPNAVVLPTATNKKKSDGIQREEKYLLVKDIANRYNVTTESVKSACERGRVPCHRVSGEWRFTQSDIEQVSSIVSRNKKVFEARPKVNIIKKANEEGQKIQSPYTINNPTPPEGTMNTQSVCQLLGLSITEIALLRKKEILVGKTIGNVPLTRGIALFYDKNEVVALGDMIKSDGGKEMFFLKLRERKGAKAV